METWHCCDRNHNGISYSFQHRTHCKRGILITTDSLLFWIQMSEQNSLLCGGELHDNLPHSQPTFLHILIPSWQLTVSMHQISSLICNQHNKLMVKTTILFLLC